MRNADKQAESEKVELRRHWLNSIGSVIEKTMRFSSSLRVNGVVAALRSSGRQSYVYLDRSCEPGLSLNPLWPGRFPAAGECAHGVTSVKCRCVRVVRDAMEVHVGGHLQ